MKRSTVQTSHTLEKMWAPGRNLIEQSICVILRLLHETPAVTDFLDGDKVSPSTRRSPTCCSKLFQNIFAHKILSLHRFSFGFLFLSPSTNPLSFLFSLSTLRFRFFISFSSSNSLVYLYFLILFFVVFFFLFPFPIKSMYFLHIFFFCFAAICYVLPFMSDSLNLPELLLIPFNGGADWGWEGSCLGERYHFTPISFLFHPFLSSQPSSCIWLSFSLQSSFLFCRRNSSFSSFSCFYCFFLSKEKKTSKKSWNLSLTLMLNNLFIFKG